MILKSYSYRSAPPPWYLSEKNIILELLIYKEKLIPAKNYSLIVSVYSLFLRQIINEVNILHYTCSYLFLLDKAIILYS